MTSNEPRSWEEEQEPMSKIDPIKITKPTNADLAKGFNQIHDCLEDHKRNTTREFRLVKRDVTEIKQALIPVKGGPKMLTSLTTRSSFLRTVAATATSIGAFLLIYRAAVALWPSVVVFIKALNHAILTGVF